MSRMHYQWVRAAWWGALLVLAVVVMATAGGCAGQSFEPETEADWITWGYAEVESIADTVTEGRTPDPVTGQVALTAKQATDVQAILQDTMKWLQVAEDRLNGQRGDVSGAIGIMRLRINDARALLRVFQGE